MRPRVASVMLGGLVIAGMAGCSGPSATSPIAPTPTSAAYSDRTRLPTCGRGQIVAAIDGIYHCVAPANPAEPASGVGDVGQGDLCDVNGATTVNTEGKTFDCEPWSDGVLRWVLP